MKYTIEYRRISATDYAEGKVLPVVQVDFEQIPYWRSKGYLIMSRVVSDWELHDAHQDPHPPRTQM